jgi:non-ribosomal peptide synthetase component F
MKAPDRLTDTRDRLAKLSPAKRALLERALLRQTVTATRIPRRTDNGPAPLGFAQRGIWFLNRWEPRSGLHSAREALSLTGPLDVPAFRRALDLVVRRHDILRTTFTEHDGQPVQVVTPASAVSVPVIDLSMLPAAERSAAAGQLRAAEASWPFDLTTGPLLRAVLIRTGAAEHVLLLSLHHIVADGWSYALLSKELSEGYTACCRGDHPPVRDLTVQFADYAAWQQHQVRRETMRAHLNWWKSQLAGAPDVLDLLAARSRPAVRDHRGGIVAATIPGHVAAGLRAVGRDAGATLFMTLLAAFQALLYRWSGQTDVVVGCPVAGRTDTSLEGLIGCFVNVLALRTNVGADMTFPELLGRVREVTLAAHAHQDVPFELLVEELRVRRDTGCSPVFQVMFAFQNTPPAVWNLIGVDVTSAGLTHPDETFDLSLSMTGSGEGLSATLSYSIDLLDAAIAERLLADFTALLAVVAERPPVPVSELCAPPPSQPVPAPAATSASDAGDAGAGPPEQVMDLLRAMWAEVLDGGEVTAETNFFTSGGHSLLAAQVIARVRQTFGVDLPLRVLFEAPTLSMFAGRVGEALRTPADALPPVRPERRDLPIPLAHAQRRLWFIDQLDPGGAHHNVATALWLDGPLDPAVLSCAADMVRGRHESLRTVFRQVEGTLCQIVIPSEPAGIPLIDVAELDAAVGVQAARGFAETEAALPFDLTTGPLLRMRLVRLASTRHVLLVTIHHIVIDAWSSELFFSELWKTYTALQGGEPTSLPPLPVQYADYAVWEQRNLDAVTRRCAGYWHRQLDGVPQALDLPYDRPLPTAALFNSAILPYELTPEETRELVAFSLREHVTVFMTALTAYLILLHRHTGQADLVVGSGTANREAIEVEPVIGFFTNQLVLRIAISSQDHVREILARVREMTLGAHAHASLPFDRVVELLRPPRRPGRPPLFHVEIEYHRRPDVVAGPPGIAVTAQELHAPTTTQDLSLHVVQTESVVCGDLVYNADVFVPGTARRLLGEFKALLATMVKQQDVSVGQLAAAAQTEYSTAVSWERAAAARARFDKLRGRTGSAGSHDGRTP